MYDIMPDYYTLSLYNHYLFVYLAYDVKRTMYIYLYTHKIDENKTLRVIDHTCRHLCTASNQINNKCE